MPHDDTDGLRMDRAVDSITVGHRHRRDVGDLQALCDSIRRVGLLCPLTVTPDGLLLCGWRRLEAVERLGWKTVPVFVRRASAGLRDLIAEHDENTIREPLPLETAEELYREYKTAETEQATLRQHATRFRAGKNSTNAAWKDTNPTDSDADDRDANNVKGGGKRDDNGSAESAAPHGEPVPGRHGDARAKAAQMVTGTKSYTRLEHTGRIRDTRDDPNMPEGIRTMAQAAWRDITANSASPEKEWKRIRAAIAEHHATGVTLVETDGQDDPADLAVVAQAALARPRVPRPATPAPNGASTARPPDTTGSLAALVAALDELVDHADAAALAADANSSDFRRLHRVTERLHRLCTEIHAARHKRHPALRRKESPETRRPAPRGTQPPLW